MAAYGTGTVRAANRYGWDYRRAAGALGPPVVPIIDAHAHLAGVEPCKVYDQVRKLFGVTTTYSMTQLHQCAPVRDLLGESVRFIAFPSFGQPDRYAAFREGYITTIESFKKDFGSGMLKLWGSPRLRDLIPELKDKPFGATDIAEIDSHWRIKQCEVGESLGDDVHGPHRGPGHMVCRQVHGRGPLRHQAPAVRGTGADARSL